MYGVRLGMGWIGSWVHKFTWQWVGLDLYVCGFGWVVGYENGPMDNSVAHTQMHLMLCAVREK